MIILIFLFINLILGCIFIFVSIAEEMFRFWGLGLGVICFCVGIKLINKRIDNKEYDEEKDDSDVNIEEEFYEDYNEEE